MEIFNQQESDLERAALQVAMQERENEIARVSRMKKSTPNVAGQAENGTWSTEIVTDVDLQLFSNVLKKKGLKAEKKELARFSVIGERYVSFHFSRSPLKSKGLRVMSLEGRMRHVLRWYNLWTVQILTAPVLARRRLRSLEDHQVFTNYRSTF